METLIILHLTDLVQLKATKLSANTAKLGYNGEACIDITSSITLSDIIIDDEIEADDGNKYTIVSIGAHSFERCVVNSIKLPHTITELQSYAFLECTCWKCIDISQTNIAQIPEFCFANCSFVTEIVLPNSYISIGEEAFCNSNLKTFIGPENLESLGEASFINNCFTLQNVDLRKTKLTKIPKDCFKNCFLSTLYLPDTLYELDVYCFYKAGPKEIHFPQSTRIIGEGAFMLSEQLSIVNLKNTKVEIISSKAFEGCTSLKSVEFSETVQSIGNEAFSMSCLCFFTYTKSLTSIGDLCFNSTLLSIVNLSDSSITYIGYSAFSNCEFLTEFIPPKSLEIISSKLLSNCPALATLEFSPALSKMEEFGLSEMSGVQLIKLSQTAITEIPANAFSGDSNLLYITLPIGLKSLDEKAFYSVDKLQRIFSCGNPLNITQKTVPSSATLYSSRYWNVAGVKQKVSANCVNIDPVSLSEPKDPADNSTVIKLAASISAVCFVLIVIVIVVIVLMRQSRKVSMKDDNSESISGLSQSAEPNQSKADYKEAKDQERRHRQRRASKITEPSKRLPELAPGIYDVTGGRRQTRNRSTEPTAKQKEPSFIPSPAMRYGTAPDIREQQALADAVMNEGYRIMQGKLH